jgi:hypothetical protein
VKAWNRVWFISAVTTISDFTQGRPYWRNALFLFAHRFQEIPVLNFTTSKTSAPNTMDKGKIRLGGACRLPTAATDTGKSERATLPARTTDSGKIRLGGACRLPVRGA